ncbi:Vitamin K epoxide reductase family protein [Planctomycetes bacterium MalM25]|nr:Vitamin K epoxide reductase family protein [Planctomycetes bacterium MalM25]
MPLLAPWITRLAAAVSLALSCYLLAISATTATAIGCDWAAFDCEAALASPWAKLLGAPVAAGGVLCYLAALVGSLLAGRRGGAGSLGWRLLEFATPLAIGAGLWFTIIQATRLESFCLYCVATHASGLVMAIAAVVWRLGQSDQTAAPMAIGLTGDDPIEATAVTPALGLPTIAGVVGVLTLVIGQTVWAPSTVITYEAELDTEFNFEGPAAQPVTPAEEASQATQPSVLPDSQADTPPRRKPNGSRPLSLLRGQLKIDAYDHAVLGSPEAPHLVVELMDYACPHCREFHDKLHEAVQRYRGQIGVVIMPVPGEILCNPYVRKAKKKSAGACYAAKLSMAVSELDPEGFEAFHEWMLEDDTIPSRTSSLIAARERVDGDDLSIALRDADGHLAAKVKQYVELAGALGRQGRFGLPSQIVGDTVMTGPSESVDALCESWAEAFGIEAPASN